MEHSGEHTRQVHPAVDEFINHIISLKGKDSHTAKAYLNDLTDFFNFLQLDTYEKQDRRGKWVIRTGGYHLGTVGLKDIKSVYVRSWISALKSEEGYTSKSINRKISSLKSFFKYFLRQGMITKIPMDRVVSLKLEERLPVYLEEKSTENLLSNLSLIGDHLHHGRAADKAPEILVAEESKELEWRRRTEELVVIILYLTGIRRSELIELEIKNVDKARKTIKVLGKGNKERQIPVSGELMDAMMEYESQKKNFLSEAALSKARSMDTDKKKGPYLLVRENGERLKEHFVYATVKKYLGEVTSQQKKSPHVLRHTFATHLTYHGATLDAVKELLGHSSLAATQVYTHNSIESLKEIHKQAHPKA